MQQSLYWVSASTMCCKIISRWFNYVMYQPYKSVTRKKIVSRYSKLCVTYLMFFLRPNVNLSNNEEENFKTLQIISASSITIPVCALLPDQDSGLERFDFITNILSALPYPQFSKYFLLLYFFPTAYVVFPNLGDNLSWNILTNLISCKLHLAAKILR